MKKIISLFLVAMLTLSLCACGKSDLVVAIEDQIKAIGEVTVNSGAEIEDIEKAIAELPEEDSKHKTKLEEKISKIREEYKALTDEKSINDTIALIDAIDESNITLESEAVINEAKKAYDNLSDDLKPSVTNKAKLDDAKNALSVLVKERNEIVIAEKTPKFNLNYDKVEDITWYEHKNLPRYIDIRSYVIPFIGKRGNNVWISTRFNYTADSWIFWEKMTIMADGEKYYKYPSRSELIRDNDTEIWEYYEETLNYNESLDCKELQILKAIAESEETIIRFEGDEYYDDLIVTSTDKQIIADALALYEALLPQ